MSNHGPSEIRPGGDFQDISHPITTTSASISTAATAAAAAAAVAPAAASSSQDIKSDGQQTRSLQNNINPTTVVGQNSMAGTQDRQSTHQPQQRRLQSLNANNANNQILQQQQQQQQHQQPPAYRTTMMRQQEQSSTLPGGGVMGQPPAPGPGNVAGTVVSGLRLPPVGHPISFPSDNSTLAAQFADGASIFPCKARGTPKDHNAQTAYFVLPRNIKHGYGLRCSHPECQKKGIRFVYCQVCNVPVAKINFTTRHKHDSTEISTTTTTSSTMASASGTNTSNNSNKNNNDNGKKSDVGTDGIVKATTVRNTSQRFDVASSTLSATSTGGHPKARWKKRPRLEKGGCNWERSAPSTDSTSVAEGKAGPLSGREENQVYETMVATGSSAGVSTSISDVNSGQSSATVASASRTNGKGTEQQWLELLHARPPIDDEDKMKEWFVKVALFQRPAHLSRSIFGEGRSKSGGDGGGGTSIDGPRACVASLSSTTPQREDVAAEKDRLGVAVNGTSSHSSSSSSSVGMCNENDQRLLDSDFMRPKKFATVQEGKMRQQELSDSRSTCIDSSTHDSRSGVGGSFPHGSSMRPGSTTTSREGSSSSSSAPAPAAYNSASSSHDGLSDDFSNQRGSSSTAGEASSSSSQDDDEYDDSDSDSDSDSSPDGSNVNRQRSSDSSKRSESSSDEASHKSTSTASSIKKDESMIDGGDDSDGLAKGNGSRLNETGSGMSSSSSPSSSDDDDDDDSSNSNGFESDDEIQ